MLVQLSVLFCRGFVGLFSLRNVLPRALSSLEQFVAPNHDSCVTETLTLPLLLGRQTMYSGMGGMSKGGMGGGYVSFVAIVDACRRFFVRSCCSDRTLTSRVIAAVSFHLLIAMIQNGWWNERRRDGGRVRSICCLCTVSKCFLRVPQF